MAGHGEGCGGVGSESVSGEQSAVGPAGSADSVVESPEQVIGHGLHIEFAKAGEEAFANFGDTIVVGVAQPPEVGGSGDEDAVFPDDDACGPGQVTGEDGTAVKGAVIIVIDEQSDFPDGQVGGAFAVGLIGGFVGVGVVVHFDDEQASIFIEGSGDGVGDEGFRGDQLEGEILLQLEGVEGLVGWDWLGVVGVWESVEQDGGKNRERWGHGFSVFSFQFSVVSCQLSVVSCQWSVVSCQWSVVSCQLSVVRMGAIFAIGCVEGV
ncbi:MAG: hypothetical protein RIT02_1920 [Planctomycetota bacterium]